MKIIVHCFIVNNEARDHTIVNVTKKFYNVTYIVKYRRVIHLYRYAMFKKAKYWFLVCCTLVS
jgi:hypothetical protein